MSKVTELDARVARPGKETSEAVFIPRDVAELMNLESFPSPWQQDVIDMYDVFEDIKVDIIIDRAGGNDTSAFVRYMMCTRKAKKIPHFCDFNSLMRMVALMPTQKMFFCNIPSSVSEGRLYQLYRAIEVIKSGYAFDDRHPFKDKYFDPPRVVVMTNADPDPAHLPRNHRNLWQIDEARGLVPYIAETGQS